MRQPRRLQAKTAKRENEHHLAFIYDHIADPIFLLAVEPEDTFRFVSVNAPFLSVTGLREEQVVSKRVQEVLPETSHALVIGKYKTAIRERKVIHWEEIAAFPTGQKVGEVTVVPVITDTGACTHLIGTVHDVTEARLMQESLRASEQTFRSMFASNPLPMWVYDLQTLRFLEVNQAAVAHYGYSREDFLRMRILDIRPPEDIGRLLQDLANDRPAQQASGEWRHRRSNGELIDVQINSHQFTLNGREVVLVVSNDITDSKRAENALRASDARKSAILNTALDGIITIDHEGKILEFNPAAEEMFGYTRDHAMGRQMAELIIPPHLRARHYQGLAHYLHTREGPVLGKRIELTGLRADGTEFPVEIAITVISANGPPVFTAHIRDLTDRKRAENEREALLRREQATRAQAETAQQRVAFLSEASKMFAASLDYQVILNNIAHAAVLSFADWCFITLVNADHSLQHLAVAHSDPAKEGMLLELQRRYDANKPGLVSDAVRTRKSILIPEISESLLESASQSTERLRFIREVGDPKSLIMTPMVLSNGVIGIINFVSTQPNRRYVAEDLAMVEDLARRAAMAIERRQMEEALAAERTLLRTLIDTVPVYINIKDLEGRYRVVNAAYAKFLEASNPDEIVGKTPFDVFPKEGAEQASADDRMVLQSDQMVRKESLVRSKTGKYTQWQVVSKVPLRDGSGRVVGIVGSAYDITERKKAEEQIAQQLTTLTALYTTAQTLSQTLNLDDLARNVVERSAKVFGAQLAWIGRAEPDGAIRMLAHWPQEHPYPANVFARWDDSPEGQGTSGRAIRLGVSVVVNDLTTEPGLVRRELLLKIGLKELGAFPLISRGRSFGVLVLYSDQSGFFSSTRVEFFRAFANQAAAALENARLFEEAADRLQHLQALRNIDMAITGSLDLRVTFNVLLDQVTTQLKADAAAILLFDPHLQSLRFFMNRGFRTAAFQHTVLRLGEGHAGRAALERRIVSVPDLTAERDASSNSPMLLKEGFTTYFAVPLIAKNEVRGVLEVFHRTPLTSTQEWMSFLEALAGQAAIAVDNTTMFDNLQRANLDLIVAYDTTLEGWSKALDLRDKETEGHTLRVTQLTLELARQMSVSDADLVHIRRGALLHDIGKMGIPDQILLKPGPLTPEEWEVMRKHPVFAYELLASIPYLHQALDIPYCHHEKWDGTGYPRGLKVDRIPLAARIFAVIDVWDALTSDRPYRAAWPADKAREHLREQTGKHFDPQVVAQFLEMRR